MVRLVYWRVVTKWSEFYFCCLVFVVQFQYFFGILDHLFYFCKWIDVFFLIFVHFWGGGMFFFRHFGMVDLGSTAKSRTRQPEVRSLSTPKNGGILGSGNSPQVQLVLGYLDLPDMVKVHGSEPSPKVGRKQGERYKPILGNGTQSTGLPGYPGIIWQYFCPWKPKPPWLLDSPQIMML